VHPPTVYFPLLVDEAMLIEPTETEPKERLDGFVDALRAVLEEAAEDPSIAEGAPYTTPVRRLDEAGAARRPVVRQPPVGHEPPGDPDDARQVTGGKL
jgi:glycine dehydrogenase subunit 2